MDSTHFESRIPIELLSQVRELSAPAREGKSITLMNAMKVKLACTNHMPESEAFAAYAQLMGLDCAVSTRPLPIRGLCDVLESEGEVLALVEPGGRHFKCRATRIVGPGSSPSLSGTIRRVVAGRIDSAVVHSRTGAFVRNGELVMDVQRDELEGVPTELAFDPVIFTHHGRVATYLEDQNSLRLRHLPKAWSLLGINSVSFGHWMIEQMLQFIAGMNLPEFQGVPILIDEGIPPQHLQSLECIGEGRFEIIEVPRGQRIAIDSLYIVTNFPFAPHLLKEDQKIDPSYFVSAMDTIAQMVAKVGALFDMTHNTEKPSKCEKLFWARPTDRHRKIDNHLAIESYISDLGCVKFYPETLKFPDQIRLIRAAKRIVVQNGSASHGLFFARPGTEVVMLSHPALPFMALYAELMAQLNIDFLVLTGPISRKGQTYLDQSDYEIPLERISQVIGHWAQ